MPRGHIALILLQREQIWGAIDENKQIWMMKSQHIFTTLMGSSAFLETQYKNLMSLFCFVLLNEIYFQSSFWFQQN